MMTAQMTGSEKSSSVIGEPVALRASAASQPDSGRFATPAGGSSNAGTGPFVISLLM